MNNKEKLIEIRRLLKEAYDHYFDYSDGHCKSGEGHISVDFGNYWDDPKCEMKISSIAIYSYVFGSGRLHHFDTLDEALKTVKTWHEEEMNHDYEKDERAEKEYWDNYFKKHPEKKIQLINPDIQIEKDYWGGPKIGN
jgi:hypothetical protein